MRFSGILIFLFLLTGCNWFASKEKRKEELVNRELREIDWQSVDTYPLFDFCDETTSKTSQRECFERIILEHVSQRIKQSGLKLSPNTDKTVQVDFIVDQFGKINLSDIRKDSMIERQFPAFDSLIGKAMDSLPPLSPALKRGIPVKAKFRLPIRLHPK